MENKIIEPQPQLALVKTEPAILTPMAMIDLALRQNAGVEQLERLMALNERWQASEAKKAFVEAVADFKAHAINILRDKTNAQYNSKYVSLGNLVATVTPFLSQHGLSCRWDIEQSAGVKVTCILTHAKGHAESVSMVCPPDASGKKNPIQEIKSAITYGKVCTFESVCGLASSDGNVDDDGNGVSNGDLSEHIEWLKNAKDLPELQALFKQAYVKFDGNKGALGLLIGAKDFRKKELA